MIRRIFSTIYLFLYVLLAAIGGWVKRGWKR
jgi:hypothetical protein